MFLHPPAIPRAALLAAALALFLAACAAPAAPSSLPPTLPPASATPLPPTPTPAPTAAPTHTPTAPAIDAPIPAENLGLTFAFIGWDGNLWLAEPAGGPARQITGDAATFAAGGEVISYYFPKISSDGRFIAARRDAGTPISEGVQYTFSLMVYDTQSGEARTLYTDPDSPPAGFDWKPASHLLAYGIGSDPNYFTGRGQIDPALATGIFFADLDSGETGLLVAPENGLLLMLPTWSQDGRFIGFDELTNMEGRGPFAYFDFQAGSYVAWGEALGNYAWSPDGSTLAYDRLTYSTSGAERIFIRLREDGAEQQLSNDPEPGYAFSPVYSPDGTQLAYLVNLGGPDQTRHTLVLHILAGGERRELGEYESPWGLVWSADGRALLFSAGPYDTQQIYGYDLAAGGAVVLAEGNQLTLAQP